MSNFRNIKFVKAWANYKPGDWAAVFDNVAKNLIAQGIAKDPTVPPPELEVPNKPAVAKKKAKARRGWSK